MFSTSRFASRIIASLPDSRRVAVINTLAELLQSSQDDMLAANATDVERMDSSNPLRDRLLLTPERIEDIADGLRNVASLPSPVGEIIEHRTLPNGLELRKVRVPFGVIGVIYEARPNVTFDVFALCLRAGSACILKGGKDAERSNEAAIRLIHRALAEHSCPLDAAVLLPPTHEATACLLNAVGQVDVCIPRGGRRLIDFVRDNARVPVIETGAGVVHTYFDLDGDTAVGCAIIANAKTRRVSVCNALDSLLIHRRRLSSLPELVAPLAEKRVELHADSESYEALCNFYPVELLVPAVAEDKDREWMDYKMGVFTVGSLGEAIDHIAAHGSGHSECIVSESPAAQRAFESEVDAACVYVNAPTSFTDGAQFGLGAEIGISTQKLGPRGPMGLREITTYRWIVRGHGQTRP